MKAAKGNRVKVHYIGTLEDGEVFDTSRERGPLEFTIGEGQLIKAFEDTVPGMEPGESRKVTVAPENAYGLYRKEMVMIVERSKMPFSLTPRVGMRLEIAMDNKTRAMVAVTDVNDREVTLDGNHPLAGKTLNFEIELVEIL